jgi:hypothetical protein
MKGWALMIGFAMWATQASAYAEVDSQGSRLRAAAGLRAHPGAMRVVNGRLERVKLEEPHGEWGPSGPLSSREWQKRQATLRAASRAPHVPRGSSPYRVRW